MKAPEGFAQRAQKEAKIWITRKWYLRGTEIKDLPYAAAWRRDGTPALYEDGGHAATWWLLLAELANDGQEAPE